MATIEGAKEASLLQICYREKSIISGKPLSFLQTVYTFITLSFLNQRTTSSTRASSHKIYISSPEQDKRVVPLTAHLGSMWFDSPEFSSIQFDLA